MSVDSRDKRASVLGIAHCLPTAVLPLADGSVNTADRQQIGWLYRGILAGAIVIPDLENFVGRRLVGDNYVGRRA